MKLRIKILSDKKSGLTVIVRRQTHFLLPWSRELLHQ